MDTVHCTKHQDEARLSSRQMNLLGWSAYDVVPIRLVTHSRASHSQCEPYAVFVSGACKAHMFDFKDCWWASGSVDVDTPVTWQGESLYFTCSTFKTINAPYRIQCKWMGSQ